MVGNLNHGIKSASYVSIKNLTLNITSTVGDGINCEEYFLMKSGTVTLSGIGDDGIQCDLGDAENPTGEIVATDEVDAHEDEDTGNFYLEGGILTITADATAAKCVKSEGSINVSDGTFMLYANGAIDLTETDWDGNIDPSYTSGFKADGNFTQSGGDITISVTGGAGRGIGVNGTLTINDGSINVTNTGATSNSSTYHCTAKGLKGGVVALNGGTVTVTMSGASAKGIKADSDDGGGHMTITGGTINVTTSGAGSYDYTDTEMRGILNNFLFSGDEVNKRVSVLSPGEKARVALCKILTKRTNVIILDEPTNHFDPETQKIIGENFKDYDGTIIMVSHNPSFVEQVGITRMLILPSHNPEKPALGIVKNYSHELLEYYYYLNSDLV